MHRHREGSGAPLVLIHGVGHHWQAWRPVIDRLAGEYDVLACDSPGCFALLSLAPPAKMPPALQPAVLRLGRTASGRAALLAQLVKRPSTMPFDEVSATLTDAFAAPAFAGALRAFKHYEFTAGNELGGRRVTVAWGDKDRLLPYGRQAPRARAALPHARHVTLDAGHVPYFDCPDAVADVIRTTAVEEAAR